MNIKELRQIVENCNKIKSPNETEIDLIENGWGIRYIRIEDLLSIIDKVSDKNEELKHWLLDEIEQAKERMEIEHNTVFDGVQVTHEQQIALNKGHIRFCEQILKMIGE